MTRRPGPAARAAMRARVGPIFPPAPSTMMSPGHASNATTVSLRGFDSRSSSSASFMILAGVRLRCRRVSCVPFDARDHRVQTDLASGQADAFHQLLHEVVGDGQSRFGGLLIDRRKKNCKKCRDRGRLPNVEIGVEVHLPVAEFGEEIDTRLALGNGESPSVECGEALGTAPRASWSSGPAPASFPRVPSPGSARARGRSTVGAVPRRYRSWSNSSERRSGGQVKLQRVHKEHEKQCRHAARARNGRVVSRVGAGRSAAQTGLSAAVQFQLAVRER